MSARGSTCIAMKISSRFQPDKKRILSLRWPCRFFSHLLSASFPFNQPAVRHQQTRTSLVTWSVSHKHNHTEHLIQSERDRVTEVVEDGGRRGAERKYDAFRATSVYRDSGISLIVTPGPAETHTHTAEKNMKETSKYTSSLQNIRIWTYNINKYTCRNKHI